MSYDISIWSTRPFDDSALLPEPQRWTVEGDRWFTGGTSWLIHTGPSCRALQEDIPDEVLGALPGIAYVTQVTLEPTGAPVAGHTLLRRVARAMAKHAHGVIVDPQKDSVELPGGVKRFAPARRDAGECYSLVEMSWWFEHADVLRIEWIDRFLTLMESGIPEALPKRYGLWEPPPHHFAETGHDHLAAFLRDHMTEQIVWYSNRPVIGWSFAVASNCAWRGGDWRCNHVAMNFEASALSQPGWPIALRRFWVRMSILLRPFYGEVRTLHDYTGRPPRVWIGPNTEENPTKSWWWKGIPPRLGHAAVVGSQYSEHWPALRSAAESHGDLLFLSTSDWRSPQDAADLVGGVPAALVLPLTKYGETEGRWRWEVYPNMYPEVFPFGDLPFGARRCDESFATRFLKR